jgi:UDP-2,3-diacylglucosamine pyrophosphatase LpxH
MRKVAIFMSDFHLGQKDRMEEFHADNEFAELLYRLSIEHAAEKNNVDLVLLGDVMDLWTTITDPNEVNAQTVAEVDLYFPATTENNALKKEMDKVASVLQKHPLFFRALATFLIDDLPRDRRIIYVPGNHDHSVVHAAIQQQIRDHIITECKNVDWQYKDEGIEANKRKFQDNEVTARIVFMNFYLDKDLQVYAEHGNQLTYGGAFRYELPPPEAWQDKQTGKIDRAKCIDDQFGKECPGYYELKLVWNRLERKSPEFDNVFMGALSPAMWPGLFWWLLIRGNLRFLSTLKRLQAQYKGYGEVIKNRRPDCEEIISTVTKARASMPAALKSVLHLWRARYHQTRDEFWPMVPRMFQQDDVPFCGHRLDPLTIKTVILGHSHHPKDEALSFPDAEGVRYYNSGSWIQRYENGRSVLEQTWVTVSREKLTSTNTAWGNIVDRHLDKRKVELPYRLSSPVTPEGPTINAVLRDMYDVRVGDVLLIRGNYGATVRRLIKARQFRDLLRFIPEMVQGWLNRYGTFSSWNHVALVYGSPFEPQEDKSYNNVLIIEAVPGAGVAIHGPQHYLEYPEEHDIALLRPKVDWIQTWEHRCLLRKLVLSRLESHYDLNVIYKKTLAHSIQSMDRQGRSGIAGLFKGAALGIVAGIVAFLLLLHEFFPCDSIQGCSSSFPTYAEMAWQWMMKLRWDAIPVNDAILKIGFYGFFLIVLAIAIGAIYGLLLVVVYAWFYAWAAAGALLGILVVPVMAELSGGWQKMTPAERWLYTFVWLVFIAAALGALVGVNVVRIPTLVEENKVPAPFETLIVLQILLFAILVTTFGKPVMVVANWLIVKPLAFIWKRIMTIVWNALDWFGFSTGEADPEFREVDKQFICSGLAQDALERTAVLIGKDPDEVRVYNSHNQEKWSDALPKHFAASDKFEWIYLLLNGQVTHRPEKSLRAEANPAPLLEKPRKLLRSSAWSLRLSLIAMFFMFAFRHANETGLKPNMVLWAGVVCVLGALWLARQAQIRLALEPERYRGRALIWWGQRIAVLAMGVGVVELGLSWTSWLGDIQYFAMGIAFIAANALLLF